MPFYEPRLAPLQQIFLHFAEPKGTSLRRSRSFSGYVPFSLSGTIGRHGGHGEMALSGLLPEPQPMLCADRHDVESTPHWPDTDDDELWEGEAQSTGQIEQVECDRMAVEHDRMAASSRQSTPPMRLSLTALLPSDAGSIGITLEEKRESAVLNGLPMSVIRTPSADPVDLSDTEGNSDWLMRVPVTCVTSQCAGPCRPGRKHACKGLSPHLPKAKVAKDPGHVHPGLRSKQPCNPGCVPKPSGLCATDGMALGCAPAVTPDKKTRRSKKTTGIAPARKSPEPLAQAMRTAVLALQKARAMMPAVDLQPAPVWSTEFELWNSPAKPKYQ